MRDGPLSQALAQLTLADVWELAPDNSEAPRRDGLRTSPFRADRNPSFSIFDGMRRYKDQSSDEPAGGVWSFVVTARPEWEKRDVARYLVERAGLQWQDATSPSKSLTALRRERQEQDRIRSDRIYRRARTHYQADPKSIQADEWPDFVRARFDAGLENLDGRVERLAERRGWPVDWVDILADLRLVSWPALPWCEKRFPAFPVTRADGTRIGYHQRIWTADDGPAWLFVPYSPRSAGNDFTRELARHFEGRAGRIVPPMPYVLGDPRQSSLWIITEGQWDAVTIFGLLGGLDETPYDLPACVFGLRGAEGGPATFLAAYGPALRRQQPLIWLLPDNDRAGSWDGRDREAGYKGPRQQSFAEALRGYLGGRTIPVSRVPARHGKDFNDYFRSAHPTRESLFGSLQRLFPTWMQPAQT